MRQISVLFLLSTLFGFGQSFGQRPGYFQQEVNYTIDVTLDDENHFLRGFESFEYINNSTDELSFLYIHLWPNAYKNQSTALAKQLARMGNYSLQNPSEKKIGYIDSLDFKADGKEVRWELDTENIDIAKLFLNEPLKPGGKVTITTPFRVKIPSGRISRLGHIDQSYQITQWYPKPAVYDENGWNQMPYLTQGEFYSEFGSFDVSITLPENYVLGATGDRQNAEDEIAFLEERIELTEKYFDNPTDSEFSLINNNEFPVSSTKFKTVRFYQEKVHDFAWFADKRYLVLKGEVALPETDRKVDTWAMFTSAEANLWKNSIEYLNDATFYYSLWNGEYPYNHVTAVDGTISAGGGMEYPNITVIGSSGSAKSLEVVIMHEVGHNWFYGILGSNERVHAWMDEGINSYNESRYMETKYPDMNALSLFIGEGIIKDTNPRRTYGYGDELSYLLTARNFEDQPIDLRSDYFSSINYGTIVYKKTALTMEYLAEFLGQDTFDRCMHEYYNLWKFKHPKPADIKSVFEEESGMDLDWFFDGLINTNKKVDFKIASSKKNSDGSYTVTVKNTGELEAPICVGSVKDGEELSDKVIWTEPMEVGESRKLNVKSTKGDHIYIDPNEKTLDFNRQNNGVDTKGILKKTEPLKIKPLTGLDDGRKTQIFWLPVWAWNEHDKNMLGLNIHNTTIPLRVFEYSITPLYSISRNDVNGLARFAYYKNNAQYKLGIQSFTDINNNDLQRQYLRISPEVKIKLASPIRSGQKRVLTLKSNYINLFTDNNENPEIELKNEQLFYFVNEAKYSFSYGNIKSDYELEINAQQIIEERGNFLYPISSMAKYGLKNKSGNEVFNLRLFGGKFVQYSNTSQFQWNTNGQNGTNDYEYDGLYLGRTVEEGILSRQIGANQGGLYKSFGRSGNNWMTSLNVSYKLHPRFPFYVYAGAAYFDVRDEEGSEWDYDYAAGISFRTGIFNVSVPLVFPELFDDAVDISIVDAISFELYLEDLNPNEIIRQNLK